MLIWLKAGAWREGVSELFKAIRMELQSLQPQDSSTIKWSKTPSGMTAHVVDTPVGAGGAKRIAPTEDAVGGGTYTGTFEVTIENGLLNVDEGWLNRNGEWLTIPAVKGIEPATGWLCICSTIENGDWTVPELRIETPSADAFPIAEIKVENDSISVRQLPVIVATIILAKVCPMAEF